ncbi:MAG TPA: rRNA adenine N-6-methyltransferase family protein [Geminicoccaceae bacterium]|nr:rRNA adenine N-6-methyltransferase family protein [Geminicoccaceae bacterium]
MQQTKAVKEGELFFRQWLRSPKSMGSVIPSSKFLARAVAEELAWKPGQWIVELGGGTGAITLGMIERGIPRERLVVIELDPDLYRYLRERLPGSLVIKGDATKLPEILKEHEVGEVGTVVSGLPMVGMPFEFQRAIIEQGFKAMPPGSFMLQYSYSPVAPIPVRRLGVRAQLVRRVALNFPPAFVWKYRHLATVPRDDHRR